jgi:type I restriction enzyme R subunit
MLDQRRVQQRYDIAPLETTKAKNIAADISHISEQWLDTDLVNHEQRIENAINKVKMLKQRNKSVEMDLDRFEAPIIKRNRFD